MIRKILSVKRPLDLTPAEVHADLALLGVSSEVHALVDDLELVPLVVDEYRKRLVVARAFNQYSRDLTKKYVPESYDCLQEVQGRLFEES